MSSTNKIICRRYAATVRQCPPHGGGVHPWIMSCANLAAMANIPVADADRDIRQNMNRPPSPASEVEDALRKAYAEHKVLGVYHKPKPPAKAVYGQHTTAAFIARGSGMDEDAWLQSSPVHIAKNPGIDDTLALLQCLYAPDEYIFCGERYGTTVRSVAEWIASFRAGMTIPPHWIPNPLTGQEHPLSCGKSSRRGDSAVAAFRFAVCEFDGMPRAAQLQFWAGFATAPIAALVDSGGKSVHAILKVNAPSREVWERDIEQGLFANLLAPLGCDPQCRNESRLSRLPGHFRREKNQWQRLLYLNPEGTPRL